MFELRTHTHIYIYIYIYKTHTPTYVCVYIYIYIHTLTCIWYGLRLLSNHLFFQYSSWVLLNKLSSLSLTSSFIISLIKQLPIKGHLLLSLQLHLPIYIYIYIYICISLHNIAILCQPIFVYILLSFCIDFMASGRN